VIDVIEEIEGIRTSKESYIQVIAYGGYDEQAVKVVISRLQEGLERNAYSAPDKLNSPEET